MIWINGQTVSYTHLDVYKRQGEDRIIFKETMDRIGVPVAKSEPVYSVEEAEKVASELGYPVVLRPLSMLSRKVGTLPMSSLTAKRKRMSLSFSKS